MEPQVTLATQPPEKVFSGHAAARYERDQMVGGRTAPMNPKVSLPRVVIGAAAMAHRPPTIQIKTQTLRGAMCWWTASPCEGAYPGSKRMDAP
jgi:hypothetical protein